MRFDPKDWRDEDEGAPVTPVTAAELERYETAFGHLFNTRVARQSIMTLGDSLSASVAAHDPATRLDSHRGPTAGHSAADWLMQANLLVDSAFDVLGSAATAGMTTEQIRTTHLPTVIAARPTYCVCFSLGANNALAAGEFPRSVLDTSLDILNKLEAEGITPILFTLPPAQGGGNLTWSEIDRYNSWVSYMAQSRGYPFLDVYGLLVNPNTGTYRPGLADDGLHPNGDGSVVLATAFAGLLAKLDRTGTRAQLLAINLRTGAGAEGTIDNPHLVGTATVPEGWTINGASAVAPATIGNRLTLTRTGGVDALGYGPSLPCAGGDVWDYAVRLGADTPGAGVWMVGLVDQDNEPLHGIAYQQRLAIPNTRVLHWRGRVPAGRTSIKPLLSAAGADGTALRVEQVTLRNLSSKSIPV